MNISSHLRQSIVIQIVLVTLILTGFLSSSPAYSDATNTSSATAINDYKTSDTIQNTAHVKTRPARKKVMIDNSRDLSAFFVFGIAINIIMAVTFAWWFSREWRRSKK